MAFNLQYFAQMATGQSASFAINFAAQNAQAYGTSNSFAYNGIASGDAQAAITTAEYFLPVANQLQLGDFIFASCTDANIILYVSAITYADNDGKNASVTLNNLAGGDVTSVSGTAGRITSTGGANPIINIDPTYVGQTSLTTLGTVTSGTWHGAVVGPTYGGTGVNNGTSTLTIGGNTAFSGAFPFTGTLTASTAVTFPTSGTLATTSQLPSLPLSVANGGTSKTAVPIVPLATTYAGWDANSNLNANSFITAVTTTPVSDITTVLTVASKQYQLFTGTDTQQIQLPATATLAAGQSFYIFNQSTLPINVETASNTELPSQNGGTSAIYTCVSTASDNATAWAVSVFGGDSAVVANNLVTAVALSPAQVYAMYATPVQVFANSDSAAVIYIEKCILDIFYDSGTYAGGGNVQLQYGNAAHGAGPAASTSIPATAFAAISESCTMRMEGYQPNPLNNSVAAGSNIYISNTSAAFSAGVAFVTVFLWYTQIEP